MATSDALGGVTEEDLKGEQSADGSSCETLKVVESEISSNNSTGSSSLDPVSAKFNSSMILVEDPSQRKNRSGGGEA